MIVINKYENTKINIYLMRIRISLKSGAFLTRMNHFVKYMLYWGFMS